MPRFLFLLSLISLICFSCTHAYYVVRHAEKATPAPGAGSDVALTPDGARRAGALKEILKNKKITYVFSTNTIRTKSTAQPTADYFHVSIETYGTKPDSAFIALLKSRKKNTLIVGHSNTVDDIVNMLCGKPVVSGDLPETEYSKLFIIKVKGHKTSFRESSYSF